MGSFGCRPGYRSPSRVHGRQPLPLPLPAPLEGADPSLGRSRAHHGPDSRRVRPRVHPSCESKTDRRDRLSVGVGRGFHDPIPAPSAPPLSADRRTPPTSPSAPALSRVQPGPSPADARSAFASSSRMPLPASQSSRDARRPASPPLPETVTSRGRSHWTEYAATRSARPPAAIADAGTLADCAKSSAISQIPCAYAKGADQETGSESRARSRAHSPPRPTTPMADMTGERPWRRPFPHERQHGEERARNTPRAV